MKHSWRFGLGLSGLAFFSAAQAGPPGPPFWNPDLTVIQDMESKLVMPQMMPGGPKAGPLESYARYYNGWTDNGHRIIYGDLVDGAYRPGVEPGIHVVPFGDRHMGGTGGMCHQIQVWYDADAKTFVEVHCYGLG